MKSMKVYVHYEGDSPMTMAMVGPEVPSMTVEQVLQKFCSLYKEKNSGNILSTCEPNQLLLHKMGSKKSLPMNCELHNKVRDKDDLFVEIDVNATPTHSSAHSHATPTQSSASGPSGDKLKVQSCQDSQPNASPDKGKASSNTTDSAEVKHLLAEGDKFTESRLLNRAVLAYKQVLRSNRTHVKALKQLVKIYLDASRADVALKYAKRLKEAYPENKEYIFRMAECYLAKKDKENADLAIEALKEYAARLRREGGGSQKQKHKVQLALSRAYQVKEQREMAIVTVQGVANEDRENLEALVEYAHLTFGLSDLQSVEAMTIVLTALVTNKDNKFFKEKFSAVCQKEGGLDYLQRVASDVWDKPSVAAFMATVLRDNGAVAEAITLFEHALDLDPDHENIFLTYVHTLELVGEHKKAIMKVGDYLQRNSHRELAGVPLSAFLSCVPTEAEDLYMYNPDFDEILTGSYKATNAHFTENELYLLAILFTLVKILYIKGALLFIPALLELLEPLEKGRELHKTIIRNEAAYFGCAKKIVSLKLLPPSPKPSQSFIYFVGDSHCVTPAWRTIIYQGKSHTIHPVLSTGTKIWHLRPGATFYPKVDFTNTIKVIPDGAHVIFAFGEIDCRESMLICVEKCRYDSLEEAMDCVIDIYINLLKELMAAHDWTIHVHPVSPVLDVTRRIVMKFNRRLKKRVMAEASLHWLDFVDKLVTEDKSKLVKEYDFDLTHLHPSYVSLLESALVLSHVSS